MYNIRISFCAKNSILIHIVDYIVRLFVLYATNVITKSTYEYSNDKEYEQICHIDNTWEQSFFFFANIL